MLKKTVRKILAFTPFELVRKQTGHARTDAFFDCLTLLGYKPKHIVDVGANRGGWTRTALIYFPDSYYSMFEPQSNLADAANDLLENPKIKLFNMGAGPTTGTMKLTTAARDDSFSFAFDAAQAAQLGVNQIDAPVVALDDFLPTIGFPKPNVLKIDAEGWDLEVIKGAEKTVAEADVVLMEAAVMCKFYKNKLADVINAMADLGFVTFDITDLNRTQRDNSLWLVEVAFVKRNGGIDCAVNSYM